MVLVIISLNGHLHDGYSCAFQNQGIYMTEIFFPPSKKKLGRCRMAIIDSASAEDLMLFTTDNVMEGSRVIGWSGYSQLAKLAYGHSVQSVSKGKDALTMFILSSRC